MILVGNKNDLCIEQAIIEEEESDYAEESNITHLRTSAKTGNGITELFKAIGNKMTENLQVNLNRNSINTEEEINEEEERNNCCCLCWFH